MTQPKAFSRSQLDELRVRFAERASQMAALLDGQVRRSFRDGELHDAEDLDRVIDLTTAFLDDVRFLLQNGRVPCSLDVIADDADPDAEAG